MSKEQSPAFQVRNYERYQHYKNRRPPWVKLHRDLWFDPKFFSLSSLSKLYVIGFFTLASENDNRIPLDIAWIRSRLGIDKKPDFKELFASGFIEEIPENASKVLATCKQSAIAEGEKEKEEEKEIEGDKKAADAAPAPEKKPRRPNKTPVPEPFEITPEMNAWANEKVPTVDLTIETEKFINHHKKKADRFVDWIAAWRLWMRNAVEWGVKSRPTPHPDLRVGESESGIDVAAIRETLAEIERKPKDKWTDTEATVHEVYSNKIKGVEIKNETDAGYAGR
jgi:hypothetical protein